MKLKNINEEIYLNDPYEQVGRHIAVGDGFEEAIVCDRIVWDYIDWLVERDATSMASIMSVLDEYRKEHDVSALLADYVYQSLNQNSAARFLAT